jgi:hypothetical protein
MHKGQITCSVQKAGKISISARNISISYILQDISIHKHQILQEKEEIEENAGLF